MSSATNSILNLIANLMLFGGGYLFYVNYITKEMNTLMYHVMRLFTALLLTGALSRVLFDINIIYTGVERNFDVLEASIALSRNLGLGGVLIYLTTRKL